MKMFALQNPDFKSLYWCAEYGWVDIDTCDKFTQSDLDKDYCIELNQKGEWISIDLENPSEYGTWAF
jgi:hypothetical protein